MIREQLRVLAGSAAVGWIVGGLLGGIIGRLAMRLLVLTSDDRLDGSITDDDARVNEFTFSGSLGLFLFLAFGGIVLAWLYVGARRSLPSSTTARAWIWGALVWSAAAPGVFEPDGFDFTQLSPRWLGVLLFSAIFVAIGALIAVGVEWALERWPRRKLGLLPLGLVGPFFPAIGGGVIALGGAALSEQYRGVRAFGSLVMAAIVIVFGVPALVDVIRILV